MDFPFFFLPNHQLSPNRRNSTGLGTMGFGTPAPLCPTCGKSVYFNEQQIGPGGKVSSYRFSLLVDRRWGEGSTSGCARGRGRVI